MRWHSPARARSLVWDGDPLAGHDAVAPKIRPVARAGLVCGFSSRCPVPQLQVRRLHARRFEPALFSEPTFRRRVSLGSPRQTLVRKLRPQSRSVARQRGLEFLVLVCDDAEQVRERRLEGGHRLHTVQLAKAIMPVRPPNRVSFNSLWAGLDSRTAKSIETDRFA
jgi:hypothetical protein